MVCPSKSGVFVGDTLNDSTTRVKRKIDWTLRICDVSFGSDEAAEAKHLRLQGEARANPFGRAGIQLIKG